MYQETVMQTERDTGIMLWECFILFRCSSSWIELPQKEICSLSLFSVIISFFVETFAFLCAIEKYHVYLYLSLQVLSPDSLDRRHKDTCLHSLARRWWLWWFLIPLFTSFHSLCDIQDMDGCSLSLSSHCSLCITYYTVLKVFAPYTQSVLLLKETKTSQAWGLTFDSILEFCCTLFVFPTRKSSVSLDVCLFLFSLCSSTSSQRQIYCCVCVKSVCHESLFLHSSTFSSSSDQKKEREMKDMREEQTVSNKSVSFLPFIALMEKRDVLV